MSWQLRATGAALRAGTIDLARARLIAEATCLLDDRAAQAVEEKILPYAGGKTTGALRAALRRAVISADPAGAERRRAEAERQARVVLHPEAESTATLSGQSLPGVHATAAMAKIKAMARAMKASGAPGSMDLLSAQVYIGLLLGTLPPALPDGGSPGYDPPSGGSPGNGGSPGCGGPPAPDDLSGSHEPPGSGEPSGDSGQDDDRAETGPEPEAAWPSLPAVIPPGLVASGTAGIVGKASARAASGLLDLSVSWATLAGRQHEPGWLGRLGPVTPVQARQLAGLACCDLATQWRIILLTPSGHARAVARIPRLRDGPGEHAGSEHGDSEHAGSEHADSEHADSDGADSGQVGVGLVGRVTLTVPDTVLDRAPPEPTGELGRILAAALRAAFRAAARAEAALAADTLAGGCAHQAATTAYRPPPSLREWVAARDLTCRFPTCRQPAWRCDLDHTLPWEDGGRTCSCNLGGLCRAHHRLKQHLLWTLYQDTQGIFRWTTPAGRTYAATPDLHPF